MSSLGRQFLKSLYDISTFYVRIRINLQESTGKDLLLNLHVFYTKPSSTPSTKSFLIFGDILVLKVS